MGDREVVDMDLFRTAVWDYVHCLFGIRHIDHNYGSVNHLLDTGLRTFVKTVCCFPERVTRADWDTLMVEFNLSEKVCPRLLRWMRFYAVARVSIAVTSF